jgi:hypothetical protein
MTQTWRELEEQGVKRCCGIFTNGMRCRKRAVEKFEFSWCDKHGPIIKAETDFALKTIKQERDGESR